MRRLQIARRGAILLSLMVVASALSAESQAAIHVRTLGTTGEIVVEANNARLPDVLRQLSDRIGFEIRGIIPTRDVSYAAPLTGSIGRVIASLLRGSNYIFVSQQRNARRLVIIPSATSLATLEDDQSSTQPASPPVEAEQPRQKFAGTPLADPDARRNFCERTCGCSSAN